MAEAETAHDMRKQEYHQEAMERENIQETEAQRRIKKNPTNKSNSTTNSTTRSTTRSTPLCWKCY